MCSLLHFPAIGDDDPGCGLAASRANGFHCLDHVISLDDLSKDDVLAVEMRRIGRADEELRAIGVPPGIGHRNRTRPEVLAGLALESLIVELAAIDRLTAGAIPSGEITALAHKVRN